MYTAVLPTWLLDKNAQKIEFDPDVSLMTMENFLHVLIAQLGSLNPPRNFDPNIMPSIGESFGSLAIREYVATGSGYTGNARAEFLDSDGAPAMIDITCIEALSPQTYVQLDDNIVAALKYNAIPLSLRAYVVTLEDEDTIRKNGGITHGVIFRCEADALSYENLLRERGNISYNVKTTDSDIYNYHDLNWFLEKHYFNKIVQYLLEDKPAQAASLIDVAKKLLDDVNENVKKRDLTLDAAQSDAKSVLEIKLASLSQRLSTSSLSEMPVSELFKEVIQQCEYWNNSNVSDSVRRAITKMSAAIDAHQRDDAIKPLIEDLQHIISSLPGESRWRLLSMKSEPEEVNNFYDIILKIPKTLLDNPDSADLDKYVKDKLRDRCHSIYNELLAKHLPQDTTGIVEPDTPRSQI